MTSPHHFALSLLALATMSYLPSLRAQTSQVVDVHSPDVGDEDAKSHLTVAFTDDFQQDSRGHYSVEGDVVWRDGQLELAQGASISRRLTSGPRTAVHLKLAPMRRNSQQPSSELRVWFRLADASPCFIRVLRTFNEGRRTLSIAMFDAVERDGENADVLIRELELRNTECPDISVEYRYGLCLVTVEGDQVFAGYITKWDAAVEGIMIDSIDTGVRLGSISVHVVPPLLLGLTTDKKRQLSDADAETIKFHQHIRQKKYAEAIRIGEQLASRRRELLGEAHPDYAMILENLSVLYRTIGQVKKAAGPCEDALRLWRPILGPQHPIYASGLRNLGTIYENTGRTVEAQSLYEQVIKLSRAVYGNLHKDYAAAVNRLATFHESQGAMAIAEPLARTQSKSRKDVLASGMLPMRKA